MKTDHETTTSAALQLNGVQKRISNFQLGPIDLTVEQGKIHALVGTNAAGKTTLLDLIMGMGCPDAGSITVNGYDLGAQEKEAKLSMAYASPEMEFSICGTISKAVRFVRSFAPEAWNDKRCEELLEKFHLDPRAKIGGLSMGSKTKLHLVLALSREVSLLILDEPTTGLDAESQRVLYQHLLERADQGVSVLLSSHQMSELERFADDISIIHEGRLLYTGQLDTLIQRYQVLDASCSSSEMIDKLPHGVRLIRQQRDRIRLLLDHAEAPADWQPEGLEIHGESLLTLEELTIHLTNQTS